MAHQELVKAWLKDAYGMEMALVPVLENHAKDAKNYPEFQQRIQEHVEETKNHAQMVKQALERLGDKPSATKSVIGDVTGAVQSVATGPFKDELVKDSLMDYGTENFEIACYNALIAAATELGDTQTAAICAEIRDEEQDMADWLDEHLPMAVAETIRKKEAEHNK